MDYVIGISTLSHADAPATAVREMARIARRRVVLTAAVDDKAGLPRWKLEALLLDLTAQLPHVSDRALTSQLTDLRLVGQRPASEDDSVRLLGITIDTRDSPRSVAIVVPHWESVPMLEVAIDSYRRHKPTEFEQRIYIADDGSSDATREHLRHLERQSDDISLIEVNRLDHAVHADIGAVIDEAVRHVEEQYTLLVHCDLFALNQDWIRLPAAIIEHYGCSSVGTDTGLSAAYPQVLSWLKMQPGKNPYTAAAGRYGNDWFTNTNDFYRMLPTAIAKVVSEQIGFTRGGAPSKRRTLELRIRPSIAKVVPGLTPWQRYPYIWPAADNGVAANHFLDINALGAKFNLPITSFYGLTPRDGAFGQNIGGLALHFALSARALSHARREVSDAGNAYAQWADALSTGSLEQRREAMLDLARHSAEFKAGGYQGEFKAEWYAEQFALVQRLRAEFLGARTPDAQR